jgi:hypothetical protein
MAPRHQLWSATVRIAVITPHYKTRPDWLERCVASVAAQTLPCKHFLVCDGDILPQIELSTNVQVLQLPRAHADFGNTPRAIGSVSAIAQDFDAIAYLDSDNWYETGHMQHLLEGHR